MAFTKIPHRVPIAIMIFFNTLVNYTLRLNLSVNIVGMAPAITNETVANSSLGWSQYERALVLGGYSWGYLASCTIAAAFSERFGPRRVMLISVLVSALLTFASPAVAKISYMWMTILRVVLGIAAGAIFPVGFSLISKWAVPLEKGKFISALISGSIGTVVAWSVSGVMVETFGWEWGFYVFGILALVWVVPWMYYVYDSPEEHPRISISEKNYICDGTSQVTKQKLIPPYGRILKSVPVWAFLFLNFGNGWGIYFVMTTAPIFIANVLNYNVSSTGFISSLTYLIRSCTCVLFGILGDYILKREFISVKALRKGFVLISHILPGCFLLGLTFVDNPLIAIALLLISFAMNGSVSLTNSANNLDLSPTFAATLYGMSIVPSSIPGIIIPLIVAYFTKHDETNIAAWQPVFYLGSVIYISTGILFIIFGSVEVQPFNDIRVECSNEVSTDNKEKTIP